MRVPSALSRIDPKAFPFISPFRSRARLVQWPLLILLVSIGLTAVAAFDAQRTVRNQRQVAERALREYASFAAWSYAQHLSLTLDGVGREVLGAVNHGDNMHTSPHVPDASDLAGYLHWNRACACRRTVGGPSPRAFFALDLGAQALTEDDNVSPDSAAQSGDYRRATDPSLQAPAVVRSFSAPFRQWILDSVSARARSRPGLNRGFQFIVERYTRDARVVAYTLMPLASGDTVVYGAVYTAAQFKGLLAAVLDSPTLLPEAFSEGRANREVLNLSVNDRSDRTLFATGVAHGADLAARVPTSFASDSLIVTAAVRSDAAGSMLIGGLPAVGVPFPLGLLGLAAALSIVAVVQIRREGELTRLRAGFVSSVSHELRTPVAQIRLFIETLRLGRTSTPEQREWALEHVDRESRRLSFLVENVLRFSALQQTPAPVGDATVDAARAAAEIVAEFQPLARARGASVILHVESAPAVFVDEGALRHMLLNLLDNAVKYGPQHQTIRVTVNGGPNCVTVCVQDEGPGILPSERETIWRPFVRGSAGQASGGSGIGLTIVRELARACGGTAEVDPAASGTRFVVRLPAVPGVSARR